MSKTYRVFLGAPSTADIQRDLTSYSWRTFSSPSSLDPTPLSRKPTRLAPQADQTSPSLTEAMFASNGSAVKDIVASGRTPSQVQSTSVVLSVDLLETASERISMIYKDAIFRDEESDDSGQLLSEETEEKEVEISIFNGADQSSVFTWPSTTKDQTDASASRINLDESSFLPHTQSSDSKLSELPARSPQEFSMTQPESQSFGVHSWTSSISRFPTFHFSLHTLSSLSSLSAQAEARAAGKFTQKVNLLLAVLEIEGPDTIRIKKGADAGKEVSILKIILGDEENNVCKLTAWREVAEEWGGCDKAEGAKRGDVVYVQSVMAACEPSTSITITASGYLKSILTICYRTMPSMVQDGRFRPDLRLAISEPCVRKVSGIVRWFEQMAGLV